MSATTKIYDYLIIGQGLAGTCLANTLLSAGKTIKVVDRGGSGSASEKAAGAIHPMIFKKLTLKWKAETLFPFALGFYQRLGDLLGTSLFMNMPLLKVFAVEKDREMWQKAREEKLSAYLDDQLLAPDVKEGLKTPFGGGWVKTAGRIRLEKMIPLYRRWLEKEKILESRQFDSDEIVQQADGSFEWNEERFNKVVFCEGAPAQNEKYWGWLPFKPAKGEFFILKTKDFPIKHMVNRGVILVPLDEERIWAGATYEWEDLSLQISDRGETQMREKLAKVLSQPYEVLEQLAGVRPATKDRRPFLGAHPKHENLYVFNGLGTRGVLIAPYFAQQLFEFMEGRGELDPEVDINRHKDLFFSS